MVVDADQLTILPKSAQSAARIEEIAAGSAASEHLAYGVLHRTVVADCSFEPERKLAESLAAQGSYSIRHVPSDVPEARSMILYSEVIRATYDSVGLIVLVSAIRLASQVVDTVHTSGKKLLLISSNQPKRVIGPDHVVHLPIDIQSVVYIVQVAATSLATEPGAFFSKGRVAVLLEDLENKVKEQRPSFNPREFGKPDLGTLIRGLHHEAVQINGARVSVALLPGTSPFASDSADNLHQ